MPRALTIRSARTAFIIAAALVITLDAGGCAKKREEPKRGAPARTESVPNVSIKSYTMAPDVELKALDGSVDRLSKYEGNVVVMTFLATWQKDAEAQIAELNKLQAKLQRYRFAVLAVFTDKDGKAAVKTFLEKNPAHFPVYCNGDEISEEFGGVRPPTTYVLLRDRNIFIKETGFRTMRALEAITLRINAMRL